MKILLIRRDNIGDLVCTTPLFTALRARFPEAWLGALVNSYNAPVLKGNPDLDAVFVYDKAKHRAPGESLLGVYWRRAQLLRSLRREEIDYAILAAPGWQPRSLRLARLARSTNIIGFVPPEFADTVAARSISTPVAYSFATPLHETEDIFRLLAPLGISGTPPSARIFSAMAARAHDRLLVGVHISARKPSQRWSAQRFARLIRALHETYDARFSVFWAPGTEANRQHPGDDEKAQALLGMLGDLPVTPRASRELPTLIEGLAECDIVVCGDGGAMHIAAGLGKPILCLFGKSDPIRWRPWGVPYVLLQHPSLDVASISVEDALAGFRALLAKLSPRIPESIA